MMISRPPDLRQSERSCQITLDRCFGRQAKGGSDPAQIYAFFVKTFLPYKDLCKDLPAIYNKDRCKDLPAIYNKDLCKDLSVI